MRKEERLAVSQAPDPRAPSPQAYSSSSTPDPWEVVAAGFGVSRPDASRPAPMGVRPPPRPPSGGADQGQYCPNPCPGGYNNSLPSNPLTKFRKFSPGNVPGSSGDGILPPPPPGT